MIQDRALASGSFVVQSSTLTIELNWAKDYGTRWYRSKERRAGESPFGSWLMNKKWTLEEEFTKHMLHFQQVTLSSYHFSKLHFDIPGWIDDQ